MRAALTESQVREIEAANPEGLTSQELVAAFSTRQVKFSEATLRKYVQLGLVPRSRRVGQKGKHLGSHGVYPVRAVRSNRHHQEVDGRALHDRGVSRPRNS